MPRYKLTIEYDGAGLVGWQRQENGPSVQAALEDAIAKFCGEQITVYGAGRTDAGVHALGQVAHIDLAKKAPADTVRNAINAHLRPAAIAVLAAEIAPVDFHARFDAIGRHYRYRILDRRAPPALERGRVWHVGAPCDAGAMHEAGQILIGKHDFSSFRATECQAKSPVKTLDALTVSRNGDEIEITARARSFLHHQVRNIVGTLRLIGEGKWSPDDLTAALAAKDRARGGPTAPAEGLCLVAVDYPEY
ncbi:MAG: tRNA pseudouridine(38-40) synthase TruA [Alphaproteobacteria bacterium]|nr:tRNA pseudouridine(38-40) synthase TruA [Alphaproteobacteria bacterium]